MAFRLNFKNILRVTPWQMQTVRNAKNIIVVKSVFFASGGDPSFCCCCCRRHHHCRRRVTLKARRKVPSDNVGANVHRAQFPDHIPYFLVGLLGCTRNYDVVEEQKEGRRKNREREMERGRRENFLSYTQPPIVTIKVLQCPFSR
jgi:hypothetical protein